MRGQKYSAGPETGEVGVVGLDDREAAGQGRWRSKKSMEKKKKKKKRVTACSSPPPPPPPPPSTVVSLEYPPPFSPSPHSET